MSTVAQNAKPKITEVEGFGIDTIPDADRTSTPWDLFRIQFGGANTFATVLLGTFPIAFGLSFWEGVAAVVLGVLVGTLFLMPMGLFGPRTGTNNAVSSGAHLGVRGRIAGSFLSLLTAIAFYSISVWVGGDALVGAFVRLFGAEDSQGLRIGLYALLGIIVIVVVVYGYQFMLLVNRVAVWANTVLMLLAVVAFSGTFDANFAGSGEYLLGDFWPTFLLSALIAMSNPISFGAFLGDWSRYIPRGTSNGKLMLATLGAQTMTLIPFIFGVATMTLVASGDYIVGLIGAAPVWYAYLIIVVAFVGGLSTGSTSLYGTGLDFSSVFPKLSRVQATIAIGAIAFAFIVAGRLFVDLLGAVNGFVGAIVVTTTPWMIIMAIGYWNRRGWYSSDDLQVFNKGKQGGRYWFANGINWRAMVAWIVSAVLGLQFAYYPPIIEGQWSGVAGGIDLSLIVAIVSAAVLYVGALLIFPEPAYAFGPKGSRIGRTTKATVPAVR